jgi:hypothetical protein
VAEIWLYEDVCRQRSELFVRVGYINMCVDSDLNCGLVLVT